MLRISLFRGFVLGSLILIQCSRCSGPRDENPGGREWKLAYVMSPGGAVHEAAEYFGQLVAEKTGGSSTLTLYPNAQLGRERELVEGLKIGSVDLVLTGPALIGWYAPEYGAIEAPFAFRSYEHLDAVLKGSVGKEIESVLEQRQSIKVLGYWHRGPRYLTTTNKVIRKPEDLRGLKLRVPELPTYIEAWRILGANPTPVPYSEMFIALKLGLVEGQENPLEVVYTSSLFEVQKYVMETEHLLSFYLLVMASRVFDNLPPEVQRAVQDAASEAGRFESDRMMQYEKEYRDRLWQEGMEFVKVDRDAFRSLVTAKLPSRFRQEWVPGLWESLTADHSGR